MDSGVVRQFRVEGGGQHLALADEHGVAGVFNENFDILANRFDDRGADENHLERILAQLCGGGVNVAGELAAVAIAQDGDVEQGERILRRAVDFFGEKDCAGAGAEERAAVCGEFLERVEEAFFLHYFQVRGAFAAGEDYAFDAGEIFRPADEGMLGAEAI